jgi:hypothetical protein
MTFRRSGCPRTFKRGINAPLLQKHANIARNAERVKPEAGQRGHPWKEEG